MMSDAALVLRARGGDESAFEELATRYRPLIRLRAQAYFLPGGDAKDLIQEGLFGLHKAVSDYRPGHDSSFRNFADLCIKRQIITAVKTATRGKHRPLNEFVSFASAPRRTLDDTNVTLEEVLPGAADDDPVERMIAQEELQVVAWAFEDLSDLERQVAVGLGEGESYAQIANSLGIDCKSVDNAAQRFKRKAGVVLKDYRREETMGAAA